VTSVTRGYSLDVDDFGDPHISFSHRGGSGPILTCKNYLKYATRTGGTWTVQAADSVGLQMWDRHSAMATNVASSSHVAYIHITGDCTTGPREIRHAIRTGSTWIVEVVDLTSFDFRADVATDPDENVHMVYRKAPASYAVRSGGSWTIENIPTIAVNAGNCALAIHDGGAEVHAAVAGFSSEFNDTWYAVRQGGSWTVENLGRGSDQCDIAVDNGGEPHLIWHKRDSAADPDSVFYATKTGGAWAIESVDGNAGSATAGSILIEVDENGNPHLVYQDLDGPLDSITYARKSGGVWQSETVDGDSIFAASIGFDLDPWGKPHLAYRRGSSAIRYATLDPASSASPASGADPIRLTIVPNPARVGEARILYEAPVNRQFDLDIYDPSGRKVRSLAAGSLARSSGSAAWDGRDDAGRLVGAGTYLVRMTLTLPRLRGHQPKHQPPAARTLAG